MTQELTELLRRASENLPVVVADLQEAADPLPLPSLTPEIAALVEGHMRAKELLMEQKVMLLERLVAITVVIPNRHFSSSLPRGCYYTSVAIQPDSLIHVWTPVHNNKGRCYTPKEFANEVSFQILDFCRSIIYQIREELQEMARLGESEKILKKVLAQYKELGEELAVK